MTRKEIVAKALEAGYQNVPISQADILVCADPSSNSSKMQSARMSGKSVIGYEEFMGMINAH